MKSGRLRRLLLALFMVATVASALHTLEHHHSHEHCPICTIAEHVAAPDAVLPVETIAVTLDDAPSVAPPESAFFRPVRRASCRAPPQPTPSA